MKQGWLAMMVVLSACGGSDGSGGGSTGSAPVPTPTPTMSPTPAPTATATPTPTPIVSVEREIGPAVTDPRITRDLDVHVAINPASATSPKGRLFVMLPGTGGPPRAYRLILRTGAARGFHTIGLGYANDLAVNDACPASTDPDCAGNMRREIILGEDRSPLVAVDAPSSIVGRLTSLLAYLARTAPGEGWDAFLVGGQPDWSRIAIGGHSQGSGHAGLMSKMFALDGVAMFAGPGDVGLGGRGIATWLSLPAVTAPARMYGFIHRDDERVPSALAQAEWRLLGLDSFGAAVELDGRTAYAGPSHQLLTTASPNPAGVAIIAQPFHGTPVVDPVTPLDASGGPQFASIWTYMTFR